MLHLVEHRPFTFHNHGKFVLYVLYGLVPEEPGQHQFMRVHRIIEQEPNFTQSEEKRIKNALKRADN
jgi:hypothetical protein